MFALPLLTQQQVDDKQQRSQACDQQVAYLLQRVAVASLFVEDVVVHLQHDFCPPPGVVRADLMAIRRSVAAQHAAVPEIALIAVHPKIWDGITLQPGFADQ